MNIEQWLAEVEKVARVHDHKDYEIVYCSGVLCARCIGCGVVRRVTKQELESNKEYLGG